jgi:hypothetical protein
VNLKGAGTGTLQDKQAACGELHNEWREDKSVMHVLEK